MRAIIRDLLPYGVVTRLSARRRAAEEAGRLRARAAMLRAPTANTTDQPTAAPRLNIGCGTHHEPGWINADSDASAPVRFTLRDGEPLPFENDSIEVVFSEHFLEHIALPDGQWFLREAHRVLQPGGLFRVSCPDLDIVVRALSDDATFHAIRRVYETVGDGRMARPEHVVNWAFYGHGHRHLWTFAALSDELTAAGFTNPHRTAFGQSRVPGAAIETRHGEAFMSLIVEATKPAR